MCGLVGVAAARMSYKATTVFKELLYANRVRGTDSTGIGIVDEKGEISLFKGTFSPIELLDMRTVDSQIKYGTKVLMGHNRAKTRGGVSRVNAHPFEFHGLLGAHNGTLSGSMTHLADNLEGETDSERLILTLAQNEDWPKVMSQTSGAWALTLYEQETNVLSLYRNSERPLFYAYDKEYEHLFWASEAGMLHWILTRNDIDFNNKIYSIPTDTMLSWVVPNSNQIFRKDPTRKKMPGKPEAPKVTVYYGAGHGTGTATTPLTHRPGAVQQLHTRPNAKPPHVPPTGEWKPWAEGFEAFKKGKNRFEDNPYPFDWTDIPSDDTSTMDDKTREMYTKWDRWDEGWLAAERAAKGGNDKRSNIYELRKGPGQSRIARGRFKELTNHQCGWCSDPVTFEDDGDFMNMGAIGPVYICEACIKNDPNILDYEEKKNGTNA